MPETARELTAEELKTLERVIRNFDHCCWDRKEHLAVLAEIQRLQQHNASLSEQLAESQAENRRLSEASQSIVAILHKEKADLTAKVESLEGQLKTIESIHADECMERDMSISCLADAVRTLLDSAVPNHPNMALAWKAGQEALAACGLNPPSTTQSPRCVEYFDKLPTTSEHVWKAGLRNEPVGNCLKCGESIQSYNERWIVAVTKLQAGEATTTKENG